LAEALKNQEKEGVARWVMRKQPYVGALRAEDDHLLLFTLRHAEEVLSAKDLPHPAGRAPDKKELTMAKQLVEMLKGEFDPKDYQDEYRERVMEFVEKKAKGHKPRLHLVKTKRKTTSLDKVLSKSIEALKKKKAA
jgi:DNA end-binding protein Ku